ncbi:hypothetical protein F5887DRAFT_930200, partial [Amanita rubescens]
PKLVELAPELVELAQKLVRELAELEKELEKRLARLLPPWVARELPPELAELVQELVRELVQEQPEAQERAQPEEQAQEQAQPEEQVQERRWKWGWKRGRVQAREQAKRGQAQVQVQALAIQVWERIWEQAWVRVWVQDSVQELALEWQAVREPEQQLGRTLGKHLQRKLGKQLGLTLGEQLEKHQGGQLGKRLGEQLGKHLGKCLSKELKPQFMVRLMLLQLRHQQPESQEQEQFQHLCKLFQPELLSKALVEVLQLGLIGELEPGWHGKCGEIVIAADTDVPGYGGMWVKWLIENLGKIVIHGLQQEPLVGCSFSGSFEFPASFSVSLKINAKTPDVAIKKFKDIEEYMKQTIERRVESVPLALGLREELQAEILNGMMTTWHLVSPQFQHNGYPSTCVYGIIIYGDGVVLCMIGEMLMVRPLSPFPSHSPAPAHPQRLCPQRMGDIITLMGNGRYTTDCILLLQGAPYG